MITDNFTLQIDFNYINGMSPMKGINVEEQKSSKQTTEPSNDSSIYRSTFSELQTPTEFEFE